MRLILILFVALVASVSAWSSERKNSKIKHSKIAVHKHSSKISESARKRLAKSQVAHARRIASLQKPVEVKAAEVTILDHGFEPPTKAEIPEPTVKVVSEDIKIEDGYAN